MKTQEKLEVQRLRREGLSYKKIQKVVPVSLCSIAIWCREIGLDSGKKRPTTHRAGNCLFCNTVTRRKSNFCSWDCIREQRYETYIEAWKSGKLKSEETYSGSLNRIHRSIRRYIFEKFENKCLECGDARINPYSHRSILHVDHIDGDATNNVEANLQLLCPSCHAMTATWCGLNRGNGTRDRKKYYGKLGLVEVQQHSLSV